jgi:hypothetical protein
MVSKVPPEAPFPEDRSGYPSPGERWLLSSMRGWASLRLAGERPQASMASTLADQASDRAATLFIAWMQAVEATLLRPIQIHHPGCNRISPDEQRLVAACGLAPIAPELGEELLGPLLLGAETVMVLGRMLNAALRAAGLYLPARLFHGSPGQPTGRMTLH